MPNRTPGGQQPNGPTTANERDLLPQNPDKEAGLPARPSAHSIFVGPQGLRPGWGCLLFLVLLTLISLTIHFVMLRLRHATAAHPGALVRPIDLIPPEFFSVLTLLLATFLMARLEHRRFLSFGLGDAAWLRRFVVGLGSGFAAISALVGLLWEAHLLTLHGPVLHGGSLWKYALTWALGFLLVGAFEELLLRGYLLFTLARGIGFGWSSLLLSLGFGLLHGNNPGETPVGLFSAALVALLFCLSIWYTGSLWWAVGFHAAWDWGESFFWSTSDSGMVVSGHLLAEHPAGNALLSGGATGPEGSVLVFPLLLVCALLLYLWWRRHPRARLPLHAWRG